MYGGNNRSYPTKNFIQIYNSAATVPESLQKRDGRAWLDVDRYSRSIKTIY